MPLYFFTIPVLSPHHQAQDDLSCFVAAHRVLRLDRQLVQAGEHSCWAVCVETQDGPGPLPASLTAGGAGAGVASKAKVDYRELLSPAEFEVFARLRALRKLAAERDGLPPYAVFTNEHLAAMVQGRATSLTALAAIDGIGPARLERYGPSFLNCLCEAYGVSSGVETPP